MKKSFIQSSVFINRSLTHTFFNKSGFRFKSMMILPVRPETFENVHPYDALKYKTQNSRQEFHEILAKTLSEGVKKFNQGKYKESEANFDVIINSFAGFETDDLTINEKRLLSSALIRKAEITTKTVPSSSWDIALSYAKMAYEIDQTSAHAQEVYLSIKSEIDSDLNAHVFESSQSVSNRT